jgi:hypothetical protein
MKAGNAEPHTEAEPDFKYSMTGKKLPVDAEGKWIRKTANWKPEEVPTDLWKLIPELHESWRDMFPDPRKMPDAVETADGTPVGEAPIPGTQ